MKKVFVLLLLCGAIFQSINAEGNEASSENKLKISAGIILSPQVSMNIINTDINIWYPFYVGCTISKNGLSITPCYEIVENMGSVFVEQIINKKHELFVYSLFSFNKHESYYSVGIEKEIKNGSLIFIELGALSEGWEPIVSFGISVPIMIKLK
jgi:hypothetical protein